MHAQRCESSSGRGGAVAQSNCAQLRGSLVKLKRAQGRALKSAPCAVVFYLRG